MKKSLIALLVATLPAAAFADVTIYGKIKSGVEYVDNGTTKQTNIDDLGSRIGFKGSENLGNGLKTIWQVESGFKTDGTAGTGSSSGTLANRETFLGLESGFGTVRFGNVSNFLDSDMGIVDAYDYSNNALGLGIFTRDGGRLKNSVRYDAPSIAGVSAAVQYGVKETKGTASNDREIASIGLGYENSGFFGKYSYQHESKAVSKVGVLINGVATNLNDTANDKHRLEVGYNANNLLVAFGYQQEKGGLDTTWLDGMKFLIPLSTKFSDKAQTKEYALTAAYTIGAFTPKFSYVKGDDVKVGGNTLGNSGYDQYVLGVSYAMSKRTTFGAQIGELDFKGDNKDQKAFGLNLVHAF